MRYELQVIRNGDLVLNYRITDKKTDSRIATSYLENNGVKVVKLMNEAEDSREKLLKLEEKVRELMQYQLDNVAVARLSKPFEVCQEMLKIMEKPDFDGKEKEDN